jgi:hypothetical protein
LVIIKKAVAKYHCIMKQINIKHISNLHNDALRGLDFYEQELTILKGRLEEIAGGNTNDEAAIGVEHFQNQFIIQQERIDELRHALHENHKRIESELLQTAGFAEQDAVAANEDLYEQYVTEEKLFNELRHEFNRFAAKWM